MNAANSKQPDVNSAAMPSAVQQTICFHCLEPLPKYGSVRAKIAEQEQYFCCHGCRSAAQLIEDEQLGEFYQRRAQSVSKVNGSEAAMTQTVHADWSFLDDSQQSKDYIVVLDDGGRQLSVHLQGLYCSSCAWLISKALQKYDHSIDSHVDIEAKTLSIVAHNPTTNLAGALTVVEKLGYQPAIASSEDYVDNMAEARKEQRIALRRIAVAGLGMMQVMTYMLAVYLGEYQGMETSFHRFFTLVSMLVATAVVLYSGKPFFDNALNDIANRHLGMDVPIALAIAGAYFPSAYLTIFDIEGAIYFDSAVMFIFFLSVGRYIEARARHRLGGSSDQLAALLPPLIKIVRAKRMQHIKPTEVKPGDRITLGHRQRLPFDGTVVSGKTSVDESLISGESMPLTRAQGDRVLAGSIVLGEGVEVIANASWHDSSIAKIARLLEQASAAHGAQVTIFDYLARYFVLFVLVLTTLVALIWWQLAPERVFEIVLAMLVASCPCAFALAGPVGIAAASHALRQKGLLITDFKALAIIPKVTTWCFDKTGTLTQGKPAISKIEYLTEMTGFDALQIAASLERHSQHSLSYAFSSDKPILSVGHFSETVGNGVTGEIGGKIYTLGKPEWVVAQLNAASLSKMEVRSTEGETIVALADQNGLLALFFIEDQLRPQATKALKHLKSQGFSLSLMSGDRQAAVDHITPALSLDSAQACLLPEQKLEALRSLQAQSEVVAMVGDGVNDAPVISQADVSLAMSSGSEVSQAQADVIILNGQLASLSELVEVANTTKRITRQNLAWALGYNGMALPLAAFGYITPWLAALGMSFSSLLVVLNALRINQANKQTVSIESPSCVDC